MQTAEVVIIGAGIVGSSIAWHLTQAGCHDVLVLEREHSTGKGSTGKSMGGVRAQFSTELNIRLSKYSIPFYAGFDERMGHPAGYRPQGYLFLATRPEHMAYLRETNALQRSLGVDAQLIGADEIAREYPQLKHDDVLGAAFCPTDGFVDPYSAMCGFMERATDAGAKLWRDAEVTSITRNGGAFHLQTARGPVSVEKIVIAAGAWSEAWPNWSESSYPSSRCGARWCRRSRSTDSRIPRR